MAEEQQAVNKEEETKEQEQGGKTYTQEDVNRMMAAKDKETKSKLEKHYQQELDQAKQISADERQKLMDEGAKRAQMTAEQKAQADLEDRQKEMDRQKALFDKQMEDFKSKQALSETKESLVDAGLPKDLATFLSDTDDEKRAQNISDFKSIFDKAVSDAVDRKVSGKKTPETGKTTQPTQNSSTITKDDWENMSVLEKSNFRQSSEENMKLADKFLQI